MAEAVSPPAERPDPRTRPEDPAGTRPKVDPESLLAAPRHEDEVDSDGVEEGEHRWLAVGSAPVAGADPAAPTRVATVDPDGDGPLLARPARSDRHAPRFQFMLGALIAIGLSAVAAAALFLVAGKHNDAGVDGWAPWHPQGNDKAEQIASHVGPEYRLASGRQLVFVTGGKLQIAGLDMKIVVQDSDLHLLKGNGTLYRLCGLGPQCAIDEGKPSIQRGLLVRREALELALYTFRYAKSTDYVVAFMPPVKGRKPTSALLFRRSSLGAPLSEPLNATLSPRTPSVVGVAAAPDTPIVKPPHRPLPVSVQAHAGQPGRPGLPGALAAEGVTRWPGWGVRARRLASQGLALC